MFGHEEANTSVFTLLAIACKDLMHLSMQVKISQPTVAAKRTMYCRLLWSKSHAVHIAIVYTVLFI